MITKIRTAGFRGIADGEVGIENKTLIVGENGSGKTSLLYAAQLALLGYIPGQDKKNQIIHARNGSMTTGVTVNGHRVDRTWTTGKGGRVSQTAEIDGKPVKAQSIADMLGLIAPNVVMDIEAFWGLSDRLRRQKALELGADPAEVSKVIDAEDQARDQLKALREEKRNAEQAVERLSGKLAGMERPAGDRVRLDESIKECEDTAKMLREQIAKSDAVKSTRKRYQDAIASREKVHADMEAAKAKADELKKGEANLRKVCAELHEQLTAYAKQSHEMLHEGAVTIVQSVIDDLNDITPDVFKESAAITSIMERLTGLLPQENAAEGIDLKATAFLLKKNEDELNAIPKTLARMREFYGINKRKLTEADQAEKELAKLPEASDANEQKALAGLETRIAELRKGKDAIIEFDTISKECEDARIARDSVSAKEDEAKEAVSAAVKAQSELAATSFDMLTTRGNGLLPFGEMEIINEEGTFTLAWNTSKRVALRDSLCGYERVVFDGAVARAIGGDDATVLIDGGEVSNDNLALALDHIAGSDKGQVVLTRWTDSDVSMTMPEEWEVVTL